MTEVTMLEFQRDSEAIIRKVQQGVSMLITECGEPVIRLEPVVTSEGDQQSGADTLLSFCELGERLVPPGPQSELTNKEIDRLIYGS
jgi:antitoxin (DNA-binding transcriptional repressor) of toxin-antitoxin stability system